MPTKMSLGQYIPGDSLIHKLDPRVKILATLVFMVSIFFVPSFFMYIPIVAYLLVIMYIAKIKPSTVLKSLKSLIFIIIFTSILNMLMTPGTDVIFKVWKFVVTKEGLYRAGFMSIRIVLLVIGTSLLTLTTSAIELTDGLESLMKPLQKVGFPAHELAMMISIALRFIPTLFEEADKIRKAQMARGADFEGGNILKKAKNMIPLLVPLFINSFRRADELATAMVSRCYRGSEGRTRLNPLKMTKKDVMIFVFVIAFFAVVIGVSQVIKNG